MQAVTRLLLSAAALLAGVWACAHGGEARASQTLGVVGKVHPSSQRERIHFFSVSPQGELRSIANAGGIAAPDGRFHFPIEGLEGYVLVLSDGPDGQYTSLTHTAFAAAQTLAVGMIDVESTVEAEVMLLALRNGWITHPHRMPSLRTLISGELVEAVMGAPDYRAGIDTIAQASAAAVNAWTSMLVVMGVSPQDLAKLEEKLAIAWSAQNLMMVDAREPAEVEAARKFYPSQRERIYQAAGLSDEQLGPASVAAAEAIVTITADQPSPVASVLRRAAERLRVDAVGAWITDEGHPAQRGAGRWSFQSEPQHSL